MHVCMECYEFYDEKFLMNFSGEILCPKTNCEGDVIELDELIAPTILLLNQKGYMTKYCCSGHWYDYILSPYIFFYDDYIPDTIPTSFKWDDHKEGVKHTIRARYDEDGSESRYDFVIRVNRELYEWAEGLPEMEWE